MGRTNDRIARLQETYVANATNGWLESLERSLAMMKEYQVCKLQLVFSANAMDNLDVIFCDANLFRPHERSSKTAA
jgi:hypothetical protein